MRIMWNSYFLVIFCVSFGTSECHLSTTGKRKNEIFRQSFDSDDETKENGPRLKFPVDFTFAAASASYQVEGGWNADGRGPSIWDTLTHDHPEKIDDHSTGDVTANSYEFFKEDVKALKEIGVDFYRFSLSWSRILPNGELSSRNQKGIDYYNRLIDTLLANGIRPIVTIFHWDLPQALQDLGGMLTPLIVDYFKIYADVVFQEFGDRVMVFTTFNEALVFCQSGYSQGLKAPGITAPGVGEYMCAHNLLLSHATMYRLYDTVYKPKFKGIVGITLNSLFYYKKNLNDSDAIVDRAIQFNFGIFAHPIFSKHGGWPLVMVEDIARNSKAEGRYWSRLPEFTEAQKKFVQGTADFLGFNYYTSRMVEYDEKYNATGPPSFGKDTRIVESVDSKWPKAKSSWLYSVPQGLRDVLRWIKEEYNNPDIMIQENGWADDGQINDVERIEFYRLHLLEVLRSIYIDGVKVRGFTFWSIIDNFEWLCGYTEKFGLYHVNFTSPFKERTPKASSRFIKNIIKSLEVPENEYLLSTV